VVFSLVIGFAVLGFLYQKLLKTKRKLATLNNKLEQSNKNKDIIFRIVSHDLKVPVNNLLIMTKKLEKSLDDLNFHVIRDYSHKINIIAIHAVETVGNLLYWSNKEVGNAAVLEDVFVHDCIHDVLDTFQIYCKLLHKSIQFECKDKDLAIRMNRVQFSTLLKNLISNAIKYSATENGKIVIEAKKLDNKILISIEDNGNGNAEEISSHFLHSESSVAATHLSGMGFKICSAIVKNYSLQIVFEKSQVLNGLKIVLII
jgi:signal transduction histidine kinase